LSFWRFAGEHSLGGLVPLVPAYRYSLGWLAGLLAIGAGFALFPALARVRSARTPLSRRAWLIGGAVTMSIGFWGTQNVALLGFALQANYYYDAAIGFAALLPTALGCAGAIALLTADTQTVPRLHLASASLGTGIATMHLVLMEAIRGDILMYYQAGLLAQSLAIPYAFALVALYLTRAHHRAGRSAWLAGSVFLGAAVLGNHFSAMAGTTFYDNPAIASSGISTIPAVTIPLTAGCVVFLLAAYWLASVIDGRLAEAGDAVRNSEARNRAVIETMLDAHLITDRAGIVRAFNPAAEATFGWTAAAIIGQPVSLLINDGGEARRQDWGQRSDRLNALPSARRRWVYPEGGQRKDGGTFPLELAVSPFSVDGNELFSCTVRDLSERWEWEAQLRRLATAIECAGDAITIMGPDMSIQYVNAQYERQSGYSRDEVMGKKPDRGASSGDVYAEIWATVGQGRSWTGQVRTRRRDGSICDEELTVTPVLDSHGAVSALVAVMRDVTRRLEAELERRRLAEALQHCTDSIEILDAQGRIVYVNAAYEAGNGQRLADIRGSRPEALLDFAAAAESYEDMMRTAYRGGRPWSGMLKSLTPAGEVREEDVTVSPMRDDRGQVTGYVVVKRDTTERRRLEAQARQRQKLHSIGEIADGIAREISQPLRALGENLRFLGKSLGSLDALVAELEEIAGGGASVPAATLAGCLQNADADFLRREMRRALDQSSDGLGRVSGIVDAMREVASASDEKAPTDLNQAIRSTITVSTAEWEPVAEVRADLDPALPPVRCVVADISLVVLDLLVTCAGAIAAGNAGGIRGKGVIAVSTRHIENCVELRIGHTGHGLRPESRHALFERRGGGENSAMALAHDIIVQKHGGSIALDTDSVDRSGLVAAFVVRLPLEPVAGASRTVAA
jgi:PAS domain S-box-containing protein